MRATVRRDGKPNRTWRYGEGLLLRIVGVLLTVVILTVVISLTSSLALAANAFAFMIVCAVFILVLKGLNWFVKNL